MSAIALNNKYAILEYKRLKKGFIYKARFMNIKKYIHDKISYSGGVCNTDYLQLRVEFLSDYVEPYLKKGKLYILSMPEICFDKASISFGVDLTDYDDKVVDLEIDFLKVNKQTLEFRDVKIIAKSQ